MGRPKRTTDGGLIYHVLNRANARMRIFEKPEDYAAFDTTTVPDTFCLLFPDTFCSLGKWHDP
jgi:hypothetical protein